MKAIQFFSGLVIVLLCVISLPAQPYSPMANFQASASKLHELSGHEKITSTQIQEVLEEINLINLSPDEVKEIKTLLKFNAPQSLILRHLLRLKERYVSLQQCDFRKVKPNFIENSTDSPSITTENFVRNQVLPDFQVNENAGGCDQFNPAITGNAAGQHVVVWTDKRNGNNDIYAQRYNSSGSKIGNNFRVNDNVSDTDRLWADVAMDAAGNFVVAWTDNRNGNYDIYGQCYSSTGVKQGSNFKINDNLDNSDQKYPRIAMNGNGEFAVIWRDYQNDTYSIYTQYFDENGTKIRKNSKVVDSAGHYFAIEMNELGNFVVMWTKHRENTDESITIVTQCYDRNGEKLGGKQSVISDDENYFVDSPNILTDNNNDFIVMWRYYGERDSSYIAYQYFDESGVKSGTNSLIALDIPTYFEGGSIIFNFDSNYGFWVIGITYDHDGYSIDLNRYSTDGELLNKIVICYLEKCGYGGNPDITVDENGNCVVVWGSASQPDIDAESFNQDGTARSHGGVNDDQGSSWQYEPAIAATTNGEFISIWLDERNFTDSFYYEYWHGNSIYGQHIDETGNKIEGNFSLCVSEDFIDTYSPSIAINDNREFVVLWVEGHRIKGQYYTNFGTKLSDFFVVKDGLNYVSVAHPSLAINNNGDFVAVWSDMRTGNNDVYGQRFSQGGTKIGDNFLINDDGTNTYQSNPNIAMDDSGNFIVTWEDQRDGTTNIFAQRYNQDGVKLGGNFQVNDSIRNWQFAPVIAADYDGNFIIAWTDSRNGTDDIYAQRYRFDGLKLGTNFQVNENINNRWEAEPTIAANQDGDFVVAWRDMRNGNNDIYAQVFDDQGYANGGNYRVNNDTGNKDQKAPDVKFVNDYIYYVWEDNRIEGQGYDIFACVDMVNKAPAVPVLAAPQNNSSVDISRPHLTFTVPQDANGDALHFKVEIARDAGFTSPIIGSPFESATSSSEFNPSPPLAAGNGVCTFTPTRGLRNGDYYWCVRAWDGFLYGPVSDVRKFMVDVPPFYITPHVNEHFLHQDFYVDIVVKDAENLQKITYYLNYPADKLAADSVLCGAFLGIDANITAEIDNTEGTVIVTQQNRHGGANGTGVVTQIHMHETMNTASGVAIELSLTGLTAINASGDTLILLPENISYETPEVQNSAPDVPQLVSPEEGYITGSRRPLLTWEVPPDADNDVLHFKVDIYKDAGMDSMIFGSPFESQIDTTGFTPLLPVPAGTGECRFEVPFSLENGDYYWRVSAWDGELYGVASATRTVIVSAQPMYITALVNDHFLYDDFYIDIQVEDAQRLAAVSFQLNFPENQLVAITAEPGNFFGPDVLFASEMNNTDGTLHVNVSSDDIEGGVNGNGIIARIKLREKSSTTSDETVNFTLSEVTGLEESGCSLNITPQNVSYITPDIQNTAPVSPQIVSPASGSNPGTNQPELTWQVPADAESDSLHFMVEIAKDSTFSEMIFSSPFESNVSITGFSPVPPLVSGNCSFTVPYPLVNDLYYWRVMAWDGITYGEPSPIGNFIIAPTGVANQENHLPEKLELTANYPNPFNPSTTIQYGLPTGSHVTIHIFDISGRKVKTLVDGQQDAGMHQVVWQANDEQGRQVSTGIYVCRMIAGNEIRHRKLIFAK